MTVGSSRASAFFAWMFFLTGVFALVSALYTWGDGWVFGQTDLEKAWLPLADLFVSAPLSFLTALGLARRARWGVPLGLVTSGVYLFGSALVYVSLVWNGPPWPWQMALPPVAGVALSIAYFVWTLQGRNEFLR